METREEIIALLRAALWECGPPALTGTLGRTDFLERVALQLEEDAQAYARKDPASRGSVATILRSYTSFRAVLHYRLAHATLQQAQSRSHQEDLQIVGMLLSSRGKLLSGIEIHPRSRIGRRLVIDHGLGTVIGETVGIGDDAYLLGGVTLGATGIAGNANGKRHPTLGHRVQVGVFAAIFGPVHIGDDVFIGSDCRITSDIEDGTRLRFHSVRRMYGHPCGLQDFPDIRVGGVIWHEIVAEDLPLLARACPGTGACVGIDVRRRALLSISHTASHLLYMAIGRFRPDVIPRTLGCHIREDGARFDFAVDGRFSPEEVAAIALMANELVARDLPATVNAHPGLADARQWHCDGHMIPCGGTHWDRTGAVGPLDVRRKRLGSGKERLSCHLSAPQPDLTRYHPATP